MSSSRDPRHTGRHGLGPHVVGQRVVVRRLLRGETGPTGGPAMTDVLGICTAWADGRCTVQPEVGGPVRIAISDIVSGKPVPPRSSVRMRVATGEAEARTASLFDSVEVDALGEWQLRWEPRPVGRLRKRANSCLAIGAPGLATLDALDVVRSFYAERGRTPYVQVEVGSELEAEITAARWRPVAGGDADFLLTSAAMLRRVVTAPDMPVELVEDGDRALVRVGEHARARAAIDDDWLGVHDMYVAPANRRRGWATGLLAVLLDWGAERGVSTVWLHVETDNAAAQTLYAALGFRIHHTCRYLAQG